jgi:hypothetical protein
LDKGIVPTEDGRDVSEMPEMETIRTTRDQRGQIELLAAFSRGILQRTDAAHRILRSAAECDEHALDLQKRDTKRRIEGQSRYIDLLLANGPLRKGLSRETASLTYSTLASPDSYAFLVGDQGWTPKRFQDWLAESLTRLLL